MVQRISILQYLEPSYFLLEIMGALSTLLKSFLAKHTAISIVENGLVFKRKICSVIHYNGKFICTEGHFIKPTFRGKELHKH